MDKQHGLRTQLKRLALLSILTVGATLLGPLADGVASASGVTATATIGAGTLNVSAPATIGFSDTLNGLNQTATDTLAVDAQDATGSGAGWNLTATSVQFATGGGATLADNSTTVQTAPSEACDANSTCTPASSSVTYPYQLPAAAGTAPAASKFYNAAASTGMGDQTVTPTFTLAIPASTLSGTYTSAWTISIVSGP